MTETRQDDRARFADVFAVGEFRALWVAQAQSRIGDQLARVALALLVFDRTSSAGLTALVYALTYLPPLLTAPLLAGLADRYSRRDVMVVIDLVRCGLVGAMAVPAVPLPGVIALLVVMTCLQPVFSAARNAALPEVLEGGDHFPVGMSVVSTTDSLAQIAGFTLGGFVVGLAGDPHVALGVDAATFVVSACLLRLGLKAHLPPLASTGGRGRRAGSALVGIRAIVSDRNLLGLVGLIWLFGLFLAPEALAAPFAREIGVGSEAVGALMAADVLGAAIGAVVVARLGPARARVMVPMAVGTGLPLVASAITPSLVSALVLWACSGVLAAYVVVGQSAFTKAVPDHLRARTLGVAAAGLQTAQGVGVLVAGGIAEVLPASLAIAVSGALGTLGAVAIAAICRPSGRT